MKRSILIRYTILILTCYWVSLSYIYAQQNGCVLKDPVVQIDFGKGSNVPEFNAYDPPNYERIWGTCPTDGHYTYTSYTSDCFQGDWFTINEDHTPGDKDGNFMLVNAHPGGGIFLSRQIKGLKSKATYELALYMMNVCRLYVCCSSLSPTISLDLSTTSGKRIITFRIGELPQRTAAQWKKYTGLFTMPAGETSLVLSIQDVSIGGCGNDFALDDITFRECVPQKVEVKAPAKKVESPVVKKETVTPVAKPVIKKEPEKKPDIAKTEKKIPAPKPVKDSPVVSAPKSIAIPRQKTARTVPVPTVLLTRSNPLIKQIEAEPGEITINLYDNGEIDGDTVSVYHNNELIVSRARLSQKPISFKIQVDHTTPYHELIMVANNLGSIPPNTSLMIVTVNEKRYKVFISSSEQKNAKVVIALKE